jgi:hypothetical protein
MMKFCIVVKGTKAVLQQRADEVEDNQKNYEIELKQKMSVSNFMVEIA